MNSDKDREIRERAYDLWVQGGRQDGNADADWARAERDVAAQVDPKTPTASSGGGSALAKKTGAQGRGKKVDGAAVEVAAPTTLPPEPGVGEKTSKAPRPAARKAPPTKGSAT